MYVGRRRTEMPPHLFAVSDDAYRHMMHGRNCYHQSFIVATRLYRQSKSIDAHHRRIGRRKDGKYEKGYFIFCKDQRKSIDDDCYA